MKTTCSKATRFAALVLFTSLGCGDDKPYPCSGTGSACGGSEPSIDASASQDAAVRDGTARDAAAREVMAAPEAGRADPARISFQRISLHHDFYSEGIGAADLDQDGHVDVVSGPFWYEGPDFVTRHSVYPAKIFDPKGYSDNFFAFPYDMNGDGFPDVLFVGFPGTDATWYENPKTKDGTWKPHLVFNVVDDESPTFTDVTGDGLPELVCAHGGQMGFASPNWAEPDALWVFHPVTPNLGFGDFTHGLGVGDVDGDGKVDLLEATGWWQQAADVTSMWTKHATPFGLGGGQMFTLMVNADSRADVITSWQAHGYGVSWFEQTETSFVEHSIAPKEAGDGGAGPLLHEPHALALGDIDNDGRVDVITGERFWGHIPAGMPNFDDPASIYWFGSVATDAGTSFVPHLVDGEVGIGTQFTVADLDADGLLDVAVANKKGASVLLQRRRDAP